MIDIKDLKYNVDGLIPAIVQHYETKEVLMLAYMNEEAIKLTIESGKTWFWSRSRQKFWNKGESSGHFQFVKDMLIDCDKDTMLLLVDQIGPACHTGSVSCFYTSINP
jgi:phosphoribosyl-AMP cyclohydrolase